MATMTRRTGNVVAGILALALTGFLVIRTSSAVFMATTDNTGNSVAAGTVQLTDDDGGTFLLQMTNTAPGESSTECIQVEYTGTIDPQVVRVYSTSAFVTTPGLDATAASMETQVNLTIEEGTAASGGVFGDCTGFVPGTTLVNGVDLATWNGAATGYATGAGTWDPAVTNETRSYRITLELDATTDNTFQGASLTGINLTFETQS